MKTKQKIFKKILLGIMLAYTLLLPLSAMAADTSKTSFTEFKGGLEAPSTQGYAAGLVQATDARSFILNVTNFFLGFLGLVAVVIIIYGGFMYVIDMGKGESGGKGKKAITYAVIGLIIVMASYAIVNTILQAPGGGGTRGAATGVGVSPGASFNRLALAVKSISKDIENTYTWQYTATQDLSTIVTGLQAAFSQVMGCRDTGSVSGQCEPNTLIASFQGSFENATTAMNRIDTSFPQFQAELDLADNTMSARIASSISLMTNYSSKAIAAARAEMTAAQRTAQKNVSDCRSAILGLGGVSSDIAKGVKDFASTFVGQGPAEAGNYCNDKFATPNYSKKIAARLLGQDFTVDDDGNVTSFTGEYPSAFPLGLVNISQFNPEGSQNISQLESRFAAARMSIKQRFRNVVIAAQRKIKEMYLIVAPITDIANTAFLTLVPQDILRSTTPVTGNDNQYWIDNDKSTNIAQLRENVTEDIGGGSIPVDEAKQIPTSESNIGKNFSATINDLSALYEMLKDLKFVDAKLTASALEGNAPLSVDFSSVGSINPNGKTILDEQITWDVYGAGIIADATGKNFDTLAALPVTTNRFKNCPTGEKIHSQTASCTYLVPGTYRVTLRIKSGKNLEDINPVTNQPYLKEIGAGISTITIKVNPPKTRINMNVMEGGETMTISKYNEEGFLEMSKDSVGVLASAAKEGIDFDATLTKAQSGEDFSAQASEGATVKWDFGDSGPGSVETSRVAATTETATPANLKKTHQYANEGVYNVKVEFVDKDKVVDRKIFDVVVSTIVADIKVPDTDFSVGKEVTFDGSNSRSDSGQIRSYEWSCAECGTDFPKSGDKISYVFSKPNENGYNVSLKVDDGQSTNSTTTTIKISSKPPVAKYSYKFENRAQPALVRFDGSKSYDPDKQKGTTPLTFEWQVNGRALKDDPGVESFKSINAQGSIIEVKFKTKNVYKIALTVTDPDDPERPSDPYEKDVEISNLLNIEFSPDSKFTASLVRDAATNELKATISPTLLSAGATAYEVDWGDLLPKDKGDFTTSVQLSHIYKQGGTYMLTARVFDADNNENSLIRKVYINSSTEPTPVITVKKNGVEAFPDENNEIVVNRKDVLTFDATNSMNTDGSGRRLQYSWSMNGSPISTKRDFNKSFGDLGDYSIELKVINADNVNQYSKTPDKVNVAVEGESPVLSSITAVPTGASQVAPVQVIVSAIDAEDPDGQIVNYRWWYYDPNDGTPLGIQISQSPQATLTIGTRGIEGEEKLYKFAVEMTDNENNKVTIEECSTPPEDNIYCLDMLPELSVTNGPNKSPVAKFDVDRTSINVGESIEFISSSSDPDGTIKAYYWDFEGDGFANNTQNEGPNVTHTFNQSAKNGIPVRLKVEDNNGSEETSDPVLIYVEGKAGAPVAAFTSMQQDATGKVDFKDNSTADIANGVTIDSWTWDFDLSFDSNGDGKNDNDTDSAQQNPTFNYADFTKIKNDYKVFGIKRAKLTVKDSEGNTSSVSNFVNVKAPVTATSTQQVKPSTQVVITQQVEPPKTTQEVQPALDARLLTDPAPNVKDGKIHLQGDSGMITLDYSTSVGNIVKYVIDKNINFDSNGNGNPADDEDKVDTKPGKWTTDFQKSWGNITIRLTVTDSKGKKDSVDKIVVFDSKTSSSSLISVLHTESNDIVALLVSIMGFAILGMLVSKISKSNQK